MLHPDSHNMFDNGSFLRRRRRFKQEAANAAHRNQQSSAGGRQRGQGNHRSSPSLISPSSTATAPNHLGGDTRPNGTKSSRARNQVSNSVGKESIADDVDCVESPRKVRKKRAASSSESATLFLLNHRNMPVDTQLQRWSRWKRVNPAIIFHRTVFHRPRRRPKHLRYPVPTRTRCPISISSIQWRWQPSSTNNQVAHHRPRLIHRIPLSARRATFAAQIPCPMPVQCHSLPPPPTPLHRRIIQPRTQTIKAIILILIKFKMERTIIIPTTGSICILPIKTMVRRLYPPPLDIGLILRRHIFRAQQDSTWFPSHHHHVP